MRGEAVFLEEGVIVEVMEPGLFRVGLPNGHRCVGYTLRRDRGGMGSLGPGDRVRIEFTSFDLSKGRVRNIEKATA